MPVWRTQCAAKASIQCLQQLLTIQLTAGMGELQPVRAQSRVHLFRRAAGSVGKLAQMDTVIVIGEQTIEIQQ